VVNRLDNQVRTALSSLSDLLPIDHVLMNARLSLSNFNEYIASESNNKHHVEMCESLDSGEDVIGIFPRNGAKTTVCSTRYPAYKLGQDRGLRILVCSCNATLAQSFLRSIEFILNQEKYQLLFGNLIPKSNAINYKWNETEKIVANRPEYNKLGYRIDAKDASLFAVGVGGAVVGRRADVIILDDIIDRKTVRTISQIQDVQHWLTEELRGVRHSKTQTVMVGTRWSTRDIYVHTMNNMLKNGASVTGNMVNEVMEQINMYKSIEDLIV
jgi:hypothetical protein